MQNPLLNIQPDYILYAGLIGILLGLVFLLVFLLRRIHWILRLLSRKNGKTPKLIASLRNLIIIFLWTAIFGMLLFLGFFLRAYHVFTYEQPVAEVRIKPLEQAQTNRITLIQYSQSGEELTYQFVIRGDQWMLEGDILKWGNWLNFLGFHTRYRFTRIRGRYLKTEDEIQKQKTIYSLVDIEDHPLWGYMYHYGHNFPFVNAVYGNAAFQFAGKQNIYKIYVSTSGFIVKPQTSETGDD